MDQKPIQIYYYCSKCWKWRSTGREKCDICPKSKTSFYITCSLVDQITAILQRPGMREKISHKYSRTKVNVNNIEDVYDSEIYKQAEQSFLVNGVNISLTWYTDGVALFESGEYSLWPFVFVINELPLHERFKMENLIIGGIWGDKCKPHPNVFTLPIYKEVCQLKTGFDVLFHGSDQKTTVKAIVLFGVCDTPAKSTFLNLKGHSGYCSCPKCYIHGEKSKRTGNVMVFPHQDLLEHRDVGDSYNDLVRNSIADPTSKTLKGVSGPTVISYMMYSSMFAGVSIDSMHSLHLGVTKQILTLLFDESYDKEPFSLASAVDEINDRLQNLELPHFVERVPENVTKLSHWKASLCRNFLQSFFLPIVQDKMRPAQFENLELLVKGVSLLNQDSISIDNIHEADELFKQFCCGFQNIYGLRHMSSNIHLLRHLARSVLETGPLFVSSAYRFEDLNGKMASLVHGTTQAPKQIFKNIAVASKLPLLIETVHSPEVKSYCTKLNKGSSQLPFSEKICSGIFVVGQLDVNSRYASPVGDLLSVVLTQPTQFRTFSRLYKNGLLYVSHSYGKGSRVSSYCKYQSQQGIVHGNILTFVKTIVSKPDKYYAYIIRSDGIPSELYRYSVYSDTRKCEDLIPIQDIITVSFCLQIKTDFPLLIDPLNVFELE
ncbi:hypothetical protein FOCC_FOCC012645 [Frankliniella occidentalis]|nr:hypothetical protein FOCC_FOCC012645 [Frankliniella occidentalis]